jgi:hypothetical protein
MAFSVFKAFAVRNMGPAAKPQEQVSWLPEFQGFFREPPIEPKLIATFIG